MTTKSILIPSSDDMECAGACFARVVDLLGEGGVIFLQGDLGLGKTTFARGFLHALGVQGPIKSPTYTLVEPYETAQWSVYHFDLYRIVNPADLHGIGIEEYFDDDSICLIEWPEKAAEVLALPDLHISFDWRGSDRYLNAVANTKKGTQWLDDLTDDG